MDSKKRRARRGPGHGVVLLPFPIDGAAYSTLSARSKVKTLIIDAALDTAHRLVRGAGAGADFAP